MKYEEVPVLTRKEVERRLRDGDIEAKSVALLSAAQYDPERAWVESACLRILLDVDPILKTVALTCIGHLARRHHTLDLEKVMPALLNARSDPELQGVTEDALDDIAMFVNHDQKAQSRQTAQ